jgi:hypothetical protein
MPSVTDHFYALCATDRLFRAAGSKRTTGSVPTRQRILLDHGSGRGVFIQKGTTLEIMRFTSTTQ